MHRNQKKVKTTEMTSVPATSQSQMVRQTIADTHLIITTVPINPATITITITSDCTLALNLAQKCYI